MGTLLGIFQRLVPWLLVASVAPMAAQPFDLEAPADSPTWWTLAPGLSPEELRTVLTDPASIRARHELSVQAGRAQSAPAAAYRGLVFFVDPRSNPELVPMPLAFILFSNNECLLLPEYSVVKRLEKAGLSESGASSVAKSCRAAAARNRELAEANRDGQAEMVALQKQWLSVNGDTEESHLQLESALRKKDVSAFRPISSKTDQELLKLIEIATDNPPMAAATAALPVLKAALTRADWELLRSYLLTWSKGLGIILDVQAWKL